MELKLELNIYKAFLYIIIILNLRVFYLVDSSVVPINDICIIVELLFFIVVYTQDFRRTEYKYGQFILFTLVLAATSSISAYYNFGGQPVFMGFRAQRHWLFAMLMYFPISKLLKNGCLSKDELMKILDNIGIILGTITIIQVLVGTSNIFMYLNNNTRYGNIRLYVSESFLILSFFYHLKKITSGNKIRLKNVLMIALSTYIIVFVSQSRMRIVSLVGAALLMLLSNKKISTRNFLILVMAVIAICAYSSTFAGENLLNLISGNGIVEEDSSVYRDVGHAYYIEENTENITKFFFGSGYANSDWSAAVNISRVDENINYNDNGIYGLFYYYGFIFIIWTALLHFRLIKDGFRSEHPDMAYVLVCGLLGIYSLFPSNYVINISFAIVCAIIENEKNK